MDGGFHLTGGALEERERSARIVREIGVHHETGDGFEDTKAATPDRVASARQDVKAHALTIERRR